MSNFKFLIFELGVASIADVAIAAGIVNELAIQQSLDKLELLKNP